MDRLSGVRYAELAEMERLRVEAWDLRIKNKKEEMKNERMETTVGSGGFPDNLYVDYMRSTVDVDTTDNEQYTEYVDYFSEEITKVSKQEDKVQWNKKLVDNARYADILFDVISNLGGRRLLALDYDADYQGYVDISVLLDDGRVWSYMYSYGSCAGCDDWEDRELTRNEIAKEMIKEATFFDSMSQYLVFQQMRKNERG